MSTTPQTPFAARLDAQLSRIEGAIEDRATTEEQCRKFADSFPTPNVLRAVALAEEGRVTWLEVRGLFDRAIGEALYADRIAGGAR